MFNVVGWSDIANVPELLGKLYVLVVAVVIAEQLKTATFELSVAPLIFVLVSVKEI